MRTGKDIDGETHPTRIAEARSPYVARAGGDAGHDERLAFERLLADLSARLANVVADGVVAEIDGALARLIEFRLRPLQLSEFALPTAR